MPRRRRTSSLAAAQQIGEQLGAQGHELVVHAQTAFIDGLSRGLARRCRRPALGAVFVALRAPGRAESSANATGGLVPAAATSPVGG